MAEDKNVIISIDDTPHSLHALHWYIEHFHNPSHVVGLAHVYTLPDKPIRGVARHNGMLNDFECEQYDKDVKKVMEEHSVLITKFQRICLEKNQNQR